MEQNVILFDIPEVRENLLPISFTRPIANIRVGITTIAEKWKDLLPGSYSFSTVDYLSNKFPVVEIDSDNDIYVAGHIIPSPELVEEIKSLKPGESLTGDGITIARRGKEIKSPKPYTGEVKAIKMLPDIFLMNDEVLKDDFKRLTDGRESMPLSPTCTVIGNLTDDNGAYRIFIEPGAKVEGAYLNVNNGPIYIGKDAEVMEGSCLRGPVALCEHSYINMGTKVYGATTIGPYSKVGGELNNVVIISYSNKAHDGFLGNAVIGEWCNLGANCVASNLKNDYSEIKLWNYPAHRFLRTGLQFCGLIMGDHTKAGINTMFNTATVVGVGCNIHGSGFPRNFVASFSEGGAAGFNDVSLNKFFEIARRVMARRHVELTDEDINIFNAIYAIAENYK